MLAPEQFLEICVESDEVLPVVHHCGCQPGVGNVVGREFLFPAELTQHGPLRAQGGHFNARYRQEAIQKPHGRVHWCGADEYSRIGDQTQETDLPRVIKILKDAGYSGWVALEYEAAEEPLEAIPRWLDKLKPLVDG